MMTVILFLQTHERNADVGLSPRQRKLVGIDPDQGGFGEPKYARTPTKTDPNPNQVGGVHGEDLILQNVFID